MNPARTVRGIWVIFERSRETLEYYRDGDVRAFAAREDLALLFPFHCASKSETGGDMNVDPSRGIGRALLTALTQLAETSRHPELASAKLMLLGFSGTGSLVGRLAEYAPDRILAVMATAPGHFEPLGVDTIRLSGRATAIPHLVLAGSADAVSGTSRPYEYFRRYFDEGGPWTFVVQNNAPHCCIMNAKALIPGVAERRRGSTSDARDGIVRLHPDPASRRNGLPRTILAAGTSFLVPQPERRMGWCELVSPHGRRCAPT